MKIVRIVVVLGLLLGFGQWPLAQAQEPQRVYLPLVIAPSLMPSAVYTLHNGQVWRISADGKEAAQLTNETEAIFSFAVAANGALAYTFLKSPSRLVLLVNGERRVVNAGEVFQLRWSPDGQTLAYNGTDPATAQKGILLQPASGGSPRMLLANIPYREPFTIGRSFILVDWAPDGQRLLLRAFPDTGPSGPGGDISNGRVGFVSVHGGSPRISTDPRSFICNLATWQPDSKAVLCSDPDGNLGREGFGLWRVNEADVQMTALRSTTDGRPLRISGATKLADGRIMMMAGRGQTSDTTDFFITQADANGSNLQVPRTVGMRLSITAYYPGVLWAADGRGLVRESVNLQNHLEWVPANNGPATALPLSGRQPQWGP